MANTELLDQYRENRKATEPGFIKLVHNKLLFNMFLLSKLPMGFITGIKVKHLDAEKCQITVPFRWVNQNPFQSTYFGVLATAAEVSSGLMAIRATYKSKPSISMLVTHMEADFVKKATGLTTFTCISGAAITQAIEQAILTGEGQTVDALTIGTSQNGEEEVRFTIRWSFKARIKN